MIKEFYCIKVGYTSGVYGNTGEQFALVIADNRGLELIYFDGKYGAEHRVIEPLKAKGYKGYTIASLYGKLPRHETRYKFVLSETEAIKKVKEYVKGRHNK